MTTATAAENARAGTCAGERVSSAEELRAGRLEGLVFDPAAKRFKRPETIAEPIGDTVFSCSAEYWAQKWSSLESKSRAGWAATSTVPGRSSSARSRPRRSPPGGGLPGAPQPDRGNHNRDEVQQASEGRFRAHSLPMNAVDLERINAFLDHYRRDYRNPNRPTNTATERRMVDDLK